MKAHHVWYTNFLEQKKLTIAELAPLIVTPNGELKGIVDDEGGPFSFEKDELNLFRGDLVRGLLPDSALYSVRVYAYPKKTRDPKYIFRTVTNKKDLESCFNRYGIDPDSIADYILVSKDKNKHTDSMIEFHTQWLDNMYQMDKNTLPILRPVLMHFDPIIWAIDGFILYASVKTDLMKIKSILSQVARKYHLEMPEKDYLFDPIQVKRNSDTRSFHLKARG